MTSTLVSRGRRGTWRHRPSLRVASVALGDMRGRCGTCGTESAFSSRAEMFPNNLVNQDVWRSICAPVNHNKVQSVPTKCSQVQGCQRPPGIQQLIILGPAAVSVRLRLDRTRGCLEETLWIERPNTVGARHAMYKAVQDHLRHINAICLFGDC